MTASSIQLLTVTYLLLTVVAILLLISPYSAANTPVVHMCCSKIGATEHSCSVHASAGVQTQCISGKIMLTCASD
jgi:hypothetical protein